MSSRVDSPNLAGSSTDAAAANAGENASKSNTSVMVGETGGRFLREALTIRNPIAVIRDFQENNALRVPSIQPSLSLLDLHRISRAHVYRTVLGQLKETLLHRVDGVGQEQLLGLLNLSFPFIEQQELRPLIMTVLSKHQNIPLQFLDTLAASPQLYDECPIEIKRQIWAKKPKLFKETVAPLLDQYLNDDIFKEIPLEIHPNHTASGAQAIYAISELTGAAASSSTHPILAVTPPTAFPTTSALPPHKRREMRPLQDLVNMIGHSLELYNIFLQHLRAKFLNSNNAAYCTLRTDIVMALHDAGASDVYSHDLAHKFAWCLTACVRDRAADLKRLTELFAIMSKCEAGNALLGDLCMIIADPFATSTLYTSAFACITECATSFTLPREHTALRLSLFFLTMGLAAHDMIEHRTFEARQLQSELLTDYAVLLVGMMLDVLQRRRDDTGPSGSNATVTAPLPKQFIDIFKSSVIAQKLTMLYVLSRTAAHDWTSLARILPVLAEHSLLVVLSDHNFTKRILSSLVGEARDNALASLPALSVILNKFILPVCMQSVDIHTHTAATLVAMQHALPDDPLAGFIPRLTREGKRPAKNDRDHLNSLHTSYQSLCFLYRDSSALEDLRAITKELEADKEAAGLLDDHLSDRSFSPTRHGSKHHETLTEDDYVRRDDFYSFRSSASSSPALSSRGASSHSQLSSAVTPSSPPRDED